MRKYNKTAMAMYQKYGPEWDSPLFHSANTTVESGPPQAPPLFVDDATEEKAEIFNQLTMMASLEEQRKHVYEAFKKLKSATDNEVARALNIVPSTVSARRNELRDQGLIVPMLDEFERKLKRKDPLTNQSNTLWKVKL